MVKIKIHQNAKIAGTKFDKRVKLSPEQKEEIAYKHKKGASKRSLAVEYGVSRRLIQFVTEPEKLAAQREKAKERKPKESKVIVVKTQRMTANQRHKKYKKFLIISGKLNKKIS